MLGWRGGILLQHVGYQTILNITLHAFVAKGCELVGTGMV